MGFKIKKTVNGETVWNPIKAKKYTTSKTIEYTGTLPITINADGSALLGYWIYGNTVQTGTPTPENPIMPEGVGEKTGNLFDIKKIKQSTKLSVSGTIIAKGSSLPNYDIFSNTEGAAAKLITSCMILEAGTYTLNFEIITGYTNMFLISICPYTSETMSPETQYIDGYPGRTFVLSEKSYVTLRIRRDEPQSLKNLMISLGSTSLPYEPYGYKLPMTVSDGNTVQTVPIYIGENKLMESEYVSYIEQKIYRDVDSTLTPTDPPVPLPEIPTIDGTTIINYDGTLKPSQMYVKYNSWSGWSDIDNYKMVNGNWTQEVT